MVDIEAKYEVLWDDLKLLHIGNFLISRKFKSFMISGGFYDEWKADIEFIKTVRSVIHVSLNYDKINAEETFIYNLNQCKKSFWKEEFIAKVIEQFIDWLPQKEDLNLLSQALLLSDFDEKHIELINKAIEKNNTKEFAVINVKSEKIEKNSNLKIFIVHGHNDAIKQSVARILEKQGLEPVILNEQIDNGLTIIEKLEKFSNVSFAIILLTADDYGNSKENEVKNKRARQNVILELGYFFAKLGRNNVMTLYEHDVELPSDFSGILYTPIDNEGHWKYKLGKELKGSGFKIDLNKI